MKKQLMIGLLSAGLVVAMLPGVALAKPTTKDAVNECRTAFATYGFMTASDCLKYVAKGGTLVPPVPTFQNVCQSLSGAYRESYVGYETVSPGCLWWGLSSPGLDTAEAALAGFCPEAYTRNWDYGATDPENDPDYFGCRPYYAF